MIFLFVIKKCFLSLSLIGMIYTIINMAMVQFSTATRLGGARWINEKYPLIPYIYAYLSHCFSVRKLAFPSSLRPRDTKREAIQTDCFVVLRTPRNDEKVAVRNEGWEGCYDYVT
jgi:hypothetical protein